MINNSLPVEEVDAEVVPFTAMGSQGELIKDDIIFVNKLDGEFSLCFSDNFIKDDNDILTETTLYNLLLNLSEDNRNKYKDRVVFIDEIPIEKQKEFIECFKTNNKDTINTTLEIIMNDYSKDKTEIITPPTTVIEDNIFNKDSIELFNYAYHLTETKYFDDMKKCGKNRNHTTKHQPDKKSKKSARRNNRRAKRNNR